MTVAIAQHVGDREAFSRQGWDQEGIPGPVKVPTIPTEWANGVEVPTQAFKGVSKNLVLFTYRVLLRHTKDATESLPRQRR